MTQSDFRQKLLDLSHEAAAQGVTLLEIAYELQVLAIATAKMDGVSEDALQQGFDKAMPLADSLVEHARRENARPN